MRRPKISLIALAPVLLLLVPARGVPAATAVGEAVTSNTILSVETRSGTVAVGTDEARSVLRSQRSAYARFTAGATGTSTVGKVERTGSKSADTGRAGADDGTYSIGNTLSLTVADASAGVAIEASRVASDAAAELAQVDAFDGLVHLDGLVSSSATEVTNSAATAARSIRLDGVSLLDVGSLLAQMGVSPYSLACGAVEDAGAALGSDTSAACEELAAIEQSISAAAAILDEAEAALAPIAARRGDLEADLAAAGAAACEPTDLACIASAIDTLVALASKYSVSLDDPTDVDASRAQVVAAIGAWLNEAVSAEEDLGLIGAEAGELAGATCDSSSATIDDVVASLSDADPAGVEAKLDSVGARLAQACGTLRSIVQALLDVSLVTMDDVVIELTTTARAGDPVAEVVASIGSLRVGLGTAFSVFADPAAAAAAAAAVTDELAVALAAFGIGFPVPEVELFAIDTASGRRDDGVWFADASVATVQLTLPAATLVIADEEPLGVLGGGVAPKGGAFGGSGVLGAPRAGMLAASLAAPPTVVRAAVFDAGSELEPAAPGDAPDPAPGDGADDGTDGSIEDGTDGSANDADGSSDPDVKLPQTGLGSDRLATVAIAMLVLAAAVRRFALMC